jgi:threonine synthase
MAAARQFGYRAVSVVSTGNAGASLAAYAMRGGLRALIFCYKQASAPKLATWARCFGPHLLRGCCDDLIQLWDRMIDEEPVFEAPPGTPSRRGKKTLAWEIAEDCG